MNSDWKKRDIRVTLRNMIRRSLFIPLLLSLIGVSTLVLLLPSTRRTAPPTHPSTIVDRQTSITQDESPIPHPLTTTSTPKHIALTFDDGPYGTSTSKILDILKQEHVMATFFVLGNNVWKFPEQVQREIREGHVLGNHSLDHSMDLPKMSAEEFRHNLDIAEDAIATTTGIRPTLFRPPYGALSQTMRAVLKQEKYRTVLWNIDPEDWNQDSSSDQIVQRILDAAKPNAIILMHDGRDTHVDYPRQNTIDALPRVIEELKERGYTFVSIEALTATQE